MNNVSLINEPSNSYELLDSGDEQKLERFGNVVLSRPDPQAIWPKSLSNTAWLKADAVFERQNKTGKWKINSKTIPDPWVLDLDGLVFNLKLLPSKHLGVFPEQLANWSWLEEKIKKENDNGRKISVLNLFAYTGGATMVCARAGAEVTHVDSSKFAVDMANKNLKSSGLKDKPVRLIVDDVRKFVEREIKRGAKYDVVLMDPPVYGKGTKDEVWKIEQDLLPFLSRIKNILSNKPLAILLNGYSSIYSSITYKQILSTIASDLGGELSSGELFLKESGHDRLLPSGIFTRWSV
jgi:23S rRNA (cytosine1962-C5)-methyltransferase